MQLTVTRFDLKEEAGSEEPASAYMLQLLRFNSDEGCLRRLLADDFLRAALFYLFLLKKPHNRTSNNPRDVNKAESMK